eukprot:TRINITY_DN336_c0_g1_i1.p1 TRINITY_DN336_c0_g1~~TRINITY_DN336_c0_g1_i1.p1  ORF type:complete len:591 (-),score=152.76 TRINITY_DN336_c0_g1_i1:75-1847(-)
MAVVALWYRMPTKNVPLIIAFVAAICALVTDAIRPSGDALTSGSRSSKAARSNDGGGGLPRGRVAALVSAHAGTWRHKDKLRVSPPASTPPAGHRDSHGVHNVHAASAAVKQATVPASVVGRPMAAIELVADVLAVTPDAVEAANATPLTVELASPLVPNKTIDELAASPNSGSVGSILIETNESVSVDRPTRMFDPLEENGKLVETHLDMLLHQRDSVERQLEEDEREVSVLRGQVEDNLAVRNSLDAQIGKLKAGMAEVLNSIHGTMLEAAMAGSMSREKMSESHGPPWHDLNEHNETWLEDEGPGHDHAYHHGDERQEHDGQEREHDAVGKNQEHDGQEREHDAVGKNQEHDGQEREHDAVGKNQGHEPSDNEADDDDSEEDSSDESSGDSLASEGDTETGTLVANATMDDAKGKSEAPSAPEASSEKSPPPEPSPAGPPPPSRTEESVDTAAKPTEDSRGSTVTAQPNPKVSANHQRHGDQGAGGDGTTDGGFAGRRVRYFDGTNPVRRESDDVGTKAGFGSDDSSQDDPFDAQPGDWNSAVAAAESGAAKPTAVKGEGARKAPDGAGLPAAAQAAPLPEVASGVS